MPEARSEVPIIAPSLPTTLDVPEEPVRALEGSDAVDTLRDLASHDLAVGEETTGRGAQTLFARHAELPGLIVLDISGTLVGVLSRSRFMALYSKPYWSDLYGARPIASFADQLPTPLLILPENTRIDMATRMALQRPSKLFSEPVVVQREGGRYGLIESQVLLSALIRIYAEQYRCLVETQDSLVQAEKMASLGNLVAGVAHEINTPLGIGITAVSYLQDRAATFEAVLESGALRKSDLQAFVATVKDSASMALQNLHRAADLVRSFKQVAVDQTSEGRRSFELGAMIDEVLTSLKPALKRSRIQAVLEPSDPVMMDSYPGALAQIITNLVMNALTHAFAPEAPGLVRVSVCPLGSAQVMVVVSDNGQGILPEHLNRIFEPFFTTRRGRGGTGLGLHIVYNRVRSTLGGKIEVVSQPGQGTTFTMTLPLHADLHGDADRG